MQGRRNEKGNTCVVFAEKYVIIVVSNCADARNNFLGGYYEEIYKVDLPAAGRRYVR